MLKIKVLKGHQKEIGTFTITASNTSALARSFSIAAKVKAAKSKGS